jgi:hypothetical protein
METADKIERFVKIPSDNPNNRTIMFVGALLLATQPEDLMLDPTFYCRSDLQKTKPEFPHYEIMIIAPDILKHPNHIEINYQHSQKCQKNFVAWGSRLTTREAAEELFTVWCVGTAFTLRYGQNFNRFLSTSLNHEDFKRLMNDQWKIELIKPIAVP